MLILYVGVELPLVRNDYLKRLRSKEARETRHLECGLKDLDGPRGIASTIWSQDKTQQLPRLSSGISAGLRPRR